MSVYVDNHSDTPLGMAVVAESLTVGSCSGDQYDTQGLVPIADGEQAEAQSFSMVRAGSGVRFTASLNEMCLDPVMRLKDADVSLVLLVNDGTRNYRLPLTASGVQMRVSGASNQPRDTVSIPSVF